MLAKITEKNGPTDKVITLLGIDDDRNEEEMIMKILIAAIFLL